MQAFQAESKRLLELMIHSIYTNQEIFLRELISNASDATDKMYIKSLSDPDRTFNKEDFFIELVPNKQNRTLTIRDHGIGMTEEELKTNLGTIAHSGSLEFKQANTAEEAAGLIGQFGVGFYSAFMVADEVIVRTRADGESEGHRWTSRGVEGYTIVPEAKDEVGTEIILHLRADEEEENYSAYLEEYRLRALVQRYSNYIRYPIRMEVTRSRRVEPEKEGEEATYEEYREMETLNSMTPIWEKAKNELKEEDYKNFYMQEHLGFDEPLRWIHLVADGALSYRAILYIPGSVPYDFYTKEYKKGLALYASGVKIMDRCEELLPDYYSFVKGVVSSEDLSLNISRETLQQDRQLLAIARKIESKISDELKKMLADDRTAYESFFASFGTQLKAGIYQSYGAKQDPLASLLLFPTSRGEGSRTLDEVVDGYGEDAKAIYYATGDSVEQMDRSPAMKALRQKDLEVLYLVDDIDEFVIRMMQTYRDLPFRSILADDFSLEESTDDAAEETADEAQKALLTAMKEALGESVVAVKVSKRLVDDAVLLVSQGDISIDMEKTFAHQPGGEKLVAQKVLEINPDHPVVKKMESLQAQGDEETLREYAELLYDQARLLEGLPIEDAATFAKRVQMLMV